MKKLTRDSLMTLEAYAKARKDFRAQVIDDLRAEILPRLGVGLEGHERVAREFFHGGRLGLR